MESRVSRGVSVKRAAAFVERSTDARRERHPLFNVSLIEVFQRDCNEGSISGA